MNKIKTKRLLNHKSQYLFTIEHNKCLNGEILHFYPLNKLIINLMSAKGLKKVGTRQQRAENIQLGEHLATN